MLSPSNDSDWHGLVNRRGDRSVPSSPSGYSWWRLQVLQRLSRPARATPWTPSPQGTPAWVVQMESSNKGSLGQGTADPFNMAYEVSSPISPASDISEDDIFDDDSEEEEEEGASPVRAWRPTYDGPAIGTPMGTPINSQPWLIPSSPSSPDVEDPLEQFLSPLGLRSQPQVSAIASTTPQPPYEPRVLAIVAPVGGGKRALLEKIQQKLQESLSDTAVVSLIAAELSVEAAAREAINSSSCNKCDITQARQHCMPPTHSAAPTAPLSQQCPCPTAEWRGCAGGCGSVPSLAASAGRSAVQEAFKHWASYPLPPPRTHLLAGRPTIFDPVLTTVAAVPAASRCVAVQLRLPCLLTQGALVMLHPTYLLLLFSCGCRACCLH